MNKPDTTFLEEQIQSITAWRREFQWLEDYGLKAEKAANFGCQPGGKSLALMWTVKAESLLGVDQDENYTHQAEMNLTQLQKDLRELWAFISKSDKATKEDIQWWNHAVPNFFKHELSKEDFYIDFIARDVTRFTGLPTNYFDVAFCDFFLHDIWWDKTRGNSERDTLFAIGQMSQVVRPRGYIAAFEWTQTATFQRLDFRRLFEQADLNVVHLRSVRIDNWRGKGYAVRIIGQKR